MHMHICIHMHVVAFFATPSSVASRSGCDYCRATGVVCATWVEAGSVGDHTKLVSHTCTACVVAPSSHPIWVLCHRMHGTCESCSTRFCRLLCAGAPTPPC